MKKNFLWMSALAAMLTLGMASCNKYDNAVPDPVIPEPTELYDLDVTHLVAVDGWGGGWCAPEYAPTVETASGYIVRLQENYQGDVNATGVILQQTIEGLTPGTYRVDLYANAFYTPERGFESDMEDGAMDVAYVFANDVKEPVRGQIATATDHNGYYQLEVEVTDGKLTLGLGKEKPGTNWHTIQIKSLVLVDGTDVEPFDASQDGAASFPTLWEGGAVVPDWTGVAQVISGGRSASMYEVYRETVDDTGVIMQQSLDNFVNGTYIVDFFATSMYTPDRGFPSDMQDGATDVAYVFANDAKTFITAKIGTAYVAAPVYRVETEVTDGTLTIGIAKAKAGTNWHTIQIKSLYLKEAK